MPRDPPLSISSDSCVASHRKRCGGGAGLSNSSGLLSKVGDGGGIWGGSFSLSKSRVT